jgi:hypothetical protein
VALDRNGKLRYRISTTSSAAATAAGGGHSAAAAAVAAVGAGTDDETEGWVRHAPSENDLTIISSNDVMYPLIENWHNVDY